MITKTMFKVLEQANIHDGWFSVSHHPMSPVKCRHNTCKSLVKLGMLDTVYSEGSKSGGYYALGGWTYRISDFGKVYVNNVLAGFPKGKDFNFDKYSTGDDKGV